MGIGTGSEEEDEGYQTAEENFGCEPEPGPQPEPESVERRLAAPAEAQAMDELLRRLEAEGWLDSRRERGREAARMFEAFGGRDKCLIRFLRAYHFADLPRSFAQLTASVDFRLAHAVSNLSRDPQAYLDSDTEYTALWPGAFVGSTATKPIQLFQYRDVRPAELVKFEEPRVLRYCLAVMERSSELQRELTERRRAEGDADFICPGVLEIHDLSGLSLSQLHIPWLRLTKRMLGVAAENYPEEAAAVVVCNAPAFAAAAWRMIRPALNVNTQKKVQITADGCRSDLAGYG